MEFQYYGPNKPGEVNGMVEVGAEAEENVIYTLTGIRIKEITRPGIYIIGKKKVIGIQKVFCEEANFIGCGRYVFSILY